MKLQRAFLTAVAVAVLSIPVGTGSALAAGGHGDDSPTVTRIASGLAGTIGGAIGPDKALYVPESALGQITRVDPKTGATSVYATGLPVGPPDVGGGVIDVAFTGGRTYALVSQVAADVGGTAIDGIYRLEADKTWTVIADLGAFSAANPPATQYDFPNGLQYAFEASSRGFVVSDGNHNRILQVTKAGKVSVLKAFDNIVPTGLAAAPGVVLLAEAGPAPHDPSTGKVVAVPLRHPNRTVTVAAGVGYLVDVELGRTGLYALSIGLPGDEATMAPAVPNTGQIVKANLRGGFTPVATGLNLPTSIHFASKDVVLVVTLTGEVWRVEF